MIKTHFEQLKHNLQTLNHFFFSRYPLTPSDDNYYRPFFILGSGRCGTTLLRVILWSHDKVVIPGESINFGSIVQKYLEMNYLPWRQLVENLFFDIKRFSSTWYIDFDEYMDEFKNLPPKNRNLHSFFAKLYSIYSIEKKPGSTVWGDKTLLNSFTLPWIDRLYPKGKFIHVLRDGRDVAASFVRCGRYKKLEQGCERWLKTLKHLKQFSKRKSTEQFLEIRYETLVAEPEHTVKKVCRFLDLSYSPKMLQFHKQDPPEDIKQYSWYKETTQPITTTSIGRWKKLPAGDQNFLNDKMKPKLSEFGYTD